MKIAACHSYHTLLSMPKYYFGLPIPPYRTSSPPALPSVRPKRSTGISDDQQTNPASCTLTKPSEGVCSLRHIPHALQVLDNSQVAIQEAIDAVLGTRLLVLVELAALDGARDAFVPADIRQVMHRLLYPRLLALIDDELLQLRLVFVRELRQVEIRRAVAVHDPFSVLGFVERLLAEV